MLLKFDIEVLIGIVSYKQKAEIYICNGYDIAKKESRSKDIQSTQISKSRKEETPVSEQCGYDI